uniref:Uncharacterized protein n=1 Tax=Aegilops tauschii subsp. strangulata TaxID=200361 RepID=A0A453GKX5_AEGTS
MQCYRFGIFISTVCRRSLFSSLSGFIFIFFYRLGIASFLNDFAICRHDTLCACVSCWLCVS